MTFCYCHVWLVKRWQPSFTKLEALEKSVLSYAKHIPCLHWGELSQLFQNKTSSLCFIYQECLILVWVFEQEFFPAVAPRFLLYWAWQLRATWPARRKNAKKRAKQAKIRLMKCEGKKTWELWWEVTAEGIHLCRTCEEIEKVFLSLLWCGDFSPRVAHTSKPMIILLGHGTGVLLSWEEIHTFSRLRKLWGDGFPQVRVSLQRKEWPVSYAHARPWKA